MDFILIAVLHWGDQGRGAGELPFDRTEAGRHVAMIFIKLRDTSLAEMSVTAIKLFSFSYLVGWIDMCFSSLFTALELPGRSLTVSFFGTLFFPIACLYLLTPIFGLNGVWLTPTVSAVASGILTVILAVTLRIPRNQCMH